MPAATPIFKQHLLCSAYVLLLASLLVASETLPPDPIQPCNYGSLPGAWNSDAEAGERWRILRPGCQLRNLLFSVKKGTWPRERTGKNDDLGILLLGDSVDGYFVGDVCKPILQGMLWPNDLAAGGICCHNKFALNNCRGSESNLVLAQHYVFGLHLDAQTHDEVLTGKGNVLERSDMALTKFDDLFAMSPRVVVFNANFWDVVRMTKHDRMHMNGFWEVSSPMLASWAANFTTWVNHVRTKLPKDTLYVYHTVPLHNFDGETGLTSTIPKLTWFKSKAVATQLNAAGREMAAQLGLGLLDMEQMCASMTPSQYLRDEKHPNEAVIAESLNVLLNMVEQWYAGKAGQVAAGGGGGGIGKVGVNVVDNVEKGGRVRSRRMHAAAEAEAIA